MVYKGLLITTESLNFLLQACITHQEAGFRHALLVSVQLIYYIIYLFLTNVMLNAVSCITKLTDLLVYRYGERCVS